MSGARQRRTTAESELREPRILWSRDEVADDSSTTDDVSRLGKCAWILFSAACGIACAVVVFALVNPPVFWHLLEDPSRAIVLIKATLPEKWGSSFPGGVDAAGFVDDEEVEERTCHKEGDCQWMNGHMKPVGEQRPPTLAIDETTSWPSSSAFYRDYVRRQRPLVMRGVANAWPATKRWPNVTYMRQAYGSTTHFRVEPNKAYTNISYPLQKVMLFDDFLERFETESLYLDSPCAGTRLLDDVVAPECLRCGEFVDGLSSTTFLMSSGNTSSSLHHDGYENLITVFSGTKTVLLFNSTAYDLMYGDEFLVHSAISPIEPDAVDLTKYPRFVEAAYGKVVLRAGDTLYIPQYWFHHVRSRGNPNMAFNVWFSTFNYEDDMRDAGINEDFEVGRTIEYFNGRVKMESADISCRNQIEASLPLSRLFTNVPRSLLVLPIERPDDFVLASGYKMPALGFGTAGLFGDELVEAVKHAVKVGYRLIDSAQAYDETTVGRAIAESGVDRSSLFLVTKIHPRHLGYESTVKSFAQSLTDLRTDYVDLLLIHAIDCDGDDAEARLRCRPGEPKGTWQESWKALEQLQRDGAARSIGVSNFDVALLEELVDLTSDDAPVSAVQNWFDPYFQDRLVRQFCERRGIVYMGYSTLGTAWVDGGVVDYNPVLGDRTTLAHVAVERDASIPQVVLRWAIDSGVVVIPRSADRVHINTNYMALETVVTKADREQIDGLEGKFRFPEDEAYYAAVLGEGSQNAAIADGESIVFIGSDDGFMYALSAVDGAVRWKFRTAKDLGSTCVVSSDGETVYFGAEDAFIYALSTRNGALKWKYETSDGVTASPRLDDGTLYCGSLDGRFYALSATDGSLVYSVDLGGAEIWSSAVVTDDAVYVGTMGEGSSASIFALRRRDGSVIWSRAIGAGVWSSPRLVEDEKRYIVVGAQDGAVYALAADDGAILWSYETGHDSVDSSVAIDANSSVGFFGTSSGDVVAVRLATGRKVWRVHVDEGEIVSSPLVVDVDYVCVGTSSGDVVALRASDGDVLWRRRVGGEIVSSPKADLGVVFIGSTNNNVLALDLMNEGTVVWSFTSNGPVVATPSIATIGL